MWRQQLAMNSSSLAIDRGLVVLQWLHRLPQVAPSQLTGTFSFAHEGQGIAAPCRSALYSIAVYKEHPRTRRPPLNTDLDGRNALIQNQYVTVRPHHEELERHPARRLQQRTSKATKSSPLLLHYIHGPFRYRECNASGTYGRTSLENETAVESNLLHAALPPQNPRHGRKQRRRESLAGGHTELCGMRRTINLNRTQAALSSGRRRLLISNSDSRDTPTLTQHGFVQSQPLYSTLSQYKQNSLDTPKHTRLPGLGSHRVHKHRSKTYLGLSVYYIQASENKRPFCYHMNAL